MLVGTAMTGTPTRPPTTLGNAPSIPAQTIDYAGFGQRLAIGQQAVNAGDPNVVEMLDFVAHHFSRDDCFFGDRDVAGPGGDDCDHAFAVLDLIAMKDDSASEFTIFGGPNFFLDHGELLRRAARGKDVAAVLREASEYLRNLR